jgi:hypothetical protein
MPRKTLALWLTVDRGGVPPEQLPGLAFKSDLFHDQVPVALLEKLSIKLLVSMPGVVPTTPDGRSLLADGTLALLYDGPDGRVFEDGRALPRAYLAPGVTAVPDEDAALRRFIDPTFDARTAAIVVGGLPADQAALLAAGAGGPASLATSTATIVRDRFTEVEVAVTSDRPAVLVLNDSWAPGWRVSIDGKSSKVVEVNFNERGVVVPAGASRVVFQYRPWALPLWIGGSVGTAFVLVAYALLWAVRGRRCARDPALVRGNGSGRRVASDEVTERVPVQHASASK